MNGYNNNYDPRRYPMPGYEYQTEPQPKQQKGNSGLKAVVGGAVAGAAVSAALVAALMGTGVLTTNAASGNAANQNRSQAITLTAASDDATTSEVVAAKCLPSVVSINVETDEGAGIGSGVILDTDGNIITNWHVAGDAKTITVTMDGQTYDATLVGGDASSDIAVVRADFKDALVTPIEVGDSSSLVVGDWVMTLGSPLGLDQSVSSGIVSALYRNQLMADTSGNTLYTNLIQVDAAINGGNSGGALVNEQGQLVGINSLLADASGGGSFSGIGFAIPGNYAVDIANKVIAGEQVTHAYIGLSCATVNEQNAQENHLSASEGAYVAEVAQNGPAQAAGIQSGDIVTKIGDEKITSADSLLLAVRTHAVGDTVDVEFVRNGKTQSTKVTLGSDEALQAAQEKQAQQQEEAQRQQLEQYEQFMQQFQNQNSSRNQMMPW